MFKSRAHPRAHDWPAYKSLQNHQPNQQSSTTHAHWLSPGALTCTTPPSPQQQTNRPHLRLSSAMMTAAGCCRSAAARCRSVAWRCRSAAWAARCCRSWCCMAGRVGQTGGQFTDDAGMGLWHSSPQGGAAQTAPQPSCIARPTAGDCSRSPNRSNIHLLHIAASRIPTKYSEEPARHPPAAPGPATAPRTAAAGCGPKRGRPAAKQAQRS